MPVVFYLVNALANLLFTIKSVCLKHSVAIGVNSSALEAHIQTSIIHFHIASSPSFPTLCICLYLWMSRRLLHADIDIANIVWKLIRLVLNILIMICGKKCGISSVCSFFNSAVLLYTLATLTGFLSTAGVLEYSDAQLVFCTSKLRAALRIYDCHAVDTSLQARRKWAPGEVSWAQRVDICAVLWQSQSQDGRAEGNNDIQFERRGKSGRARFCWASRLDFQTSRIRHIQSEVAS